MSDINLEAERELDNLANDLTYNALKFSPLFRVLENDELDVTAELLAKEVRALVSRRVDEIFEAKASETELAAA